MFIEGTEITLRNYKQIFKVCTPDVLDEIRLAILDNTDILAFINICGTDNFKLGQYRLAVREGVSFKYLIPGITGKTITWIRTCHRQHINMQCLERYIRGSKLTLSPEMFEYIVQAVSLGADISKVDFTDVPEKTYKVICEGLVRKYPMWLFVGYNLSERYIRLLMRGLDLGIDISPCVENVYTEDKLVYIFANKEYSGILKHITPKFSLDSIKVLIQASKEGLDISQLLYRDTDGYPVYSEFQMKALLAALRVQKLGILVDDVFDPKLSDVDMLEKLDGYMNQNIDVILQADLPS